MFNTQPAHWIEHTPDWTKLQNTFAAGSGQDVNQIPTHLTNLSHRSPVAVCFTIQGDANNIYVCHLPTIFPGNPANVTLFDNHCVVLFGNNIDNKSSPWQWKLLVPGSVNLRDGGQSVSQTMVLLNLPCRA
jgi:hypothetical protein